MYIFKCRFTQPLKSLASREGPIKPPFQPVLQAPIQSLILRNKRLPLNKHSWLFSTVHSRLCGAYVRILNVKNRLAIEKTLMPVFGELQVAGKVCPRRDELHSVIVLIPK